MPVVSNETIEEAEPSLAFGLLHERVQRWIWLQNWTSLRDIQEQSIPILLGQNEDLIIAASTASGKTEAAFLPIVSRIAWDNPQPGAGFSAIYISPMRALINDQFARIEGLCDDLAIPVVKWHGDVSASVKARARANPHGILLTTPESIEAMLCRRGPEARRMFASLTHVVIDELHAFIDVPRGRQLQSLLNRLEIAVGHPVCRVGLSATLADMSMAAQFLRPKEPSRVTILKSDGGGGNLLLQVRGYIEPPPTPPQQGTDPNAVPDRVTDTAIAQHIFETMRGSRGLIFAGSRQGVEMLAVRLHTLSEDLGVPEEFFPHHASLSQEIREDSEKRLKDENRPGSIICTTTMELGIDVGHIESVAQLGPGHTVSGMRQRIGRSGRREGQPSVMRAYVSEMALTHRSHPLEALRLRTVMTIAMTNLMLRRWNEPPVQGRLHLSTLVHQTLALIAQHGGITAAQGFGRLVDSQVFPTVTVETFAAVLRRMAHPDVALIEQAPDGTLLPGRQGERVIAGRDFYAVFMTPEEFKVVTDRGRTLGTIPMTNPVLPEQLIILGGRRWKVLELDTKRCEILVTKATGGKPPIFGGEPGAPVDEVVAEMRRLFEGDDVPTYLDEVALQLIQEGRAAFSRLRLATSSVCRAGNQLLIFPWVGGQAQNSLMLALIERGVTASPMGVALGVSCSIHDLRTALNGIAASPAPDPVALARLVPDKLRAKYDVYLGDDLLSLDWASDNINAARIPLMAQEVIRKMPDLLDAA